MTYRYRFGLIGVGIIIFLFLTPFLVLFARGFQIDWENRTFIKTGTLSIKSEPNDAQIFINDELHKSTTAANIRYMLPGDYNVRLEKDGYQSWTKRLNIKSQLVTWANANRDYITLFFKEPKLVEDFAVSESSLSRNGQEILYFTSDSIGLLGANNGNSASLAKINNLQIPERLISLAKWEDGRGVINFLANNQDSWQTLEDQIDNITALEINGSAIAATIDSNLYTLDSGRLKLLDIAVSSFTLLGTDIWYIHQNSLKHFNFSSGSANVIYENLPSFSNSKILRTDNQIYLILDETLYVINDELEKIASSVLYANYDPSSNWIVYGNINEISLYYPELKKSELIMRSLTEISNPLINSDTGYLFFLNENKVKAIELDSRGHRNIFTIANVTGSFALSKNGKRLFITETDKISSYQIR